MFRFFRLIFLRHVRAVLSLFFVLLLANTWFLVIRQVTENVEQIVAKETGPLFGADVIVSPRTYTAVPIIDQVRPILSGSSYSWWERTEFSSTLLDREGKTWLVKVIAYTWEYPQKWILETTIPLTWRYVAATPNILDRFTTNSWLVLDGKNIDITHTIENSSDIGFSFGTENALLVLPRESLSGSMLISSGSRLDQDLLLSFPASTDIKKALSLLRESDTLSGSRIRSYDERSERNIGTVEELGSYILLILVVAAIFAGIILRSAHDGLFTELSKTLSIMEILGFSRKRQIWVFLLFYLIIIPGSFIASVLLGIAIMKGLQQIPEASEFVFLISPVYFTLIVSILLILSSFLPAWGERFYSEKLRITLFKKTFSLVQGLPLFLGIFGILIVIFESLVWSLGIVVLALGILIIFTGIFEYILKKIFHSITQYRKTHFWSYDALRTLVRPWVPTIPIIISLISIASFFVVFLSFSLSFREKLLSDTRDSANIYAINILEEDVAAIQQLSASGELYSIMRARIINVNGASLADHLSTPEPTGEFTREFNITSDDLEAPIVRWKKIEKWDEMSMDEEFAKRLWVDIGDTIDFSISGRVFSIRIVSIRSSIREGFRPFFYFQFEKKAFENAPKTYFLSTYSTDTESWKKQILEATGPHVTFVDIENILSIARVVAEKILWVISLFFLLISIFWFLAILSLFARFAPIERIKERLYMLFWWRKKDIARSLIWSRYFILVFSLLLSIVIGFSLAYYMLSTTSFFTISPNDSLLVSAIIVTIFAILALVIRPKTKK